MVLIEPDETFAETLYFWHFLLRIDSKTLFSQKCGLTPNTTREPSDQSSACIDYPPVRASVGCVMGNLLKGFLGRNWTSPSHFESLREFFAKETGRNEFVLG